MLILDSTSFNEQEKHILDLHCERQRIAAMLGSAVAITAAIGCLSVVSEASTKKRTLVGTWRYKIPPNNR